MFTICIIRLFSGSGSLGIFTSIFSITSALIGLIFVKVIRTNYYKTLMISASTITIILLYIMLSNCNFVTIVLYNLFQTISKGLIDIKAIKQEFKVEHFLSRETSLFIGRVISNVLFIFMTFINSNFIMAIFVVFAIMRTISSIRIEISMSKCKKVNIDCVGVICNE